MLIKSLASRIEDNFLRIGQCLHGTRDFWERKRSLAAGLRTFGSDTSSDEETEEQPMSISQEVPAQVMRVSES